MSYDYRIVARNSLADLEQSVRQLQREDWEMQRTGVELTVEDALDAISERKMVSVKMRKEKKE